MKRFLFISMMIFVLSVAKGFSQSPRPEIKGQYRFSYNINVIHSRTDRICGNNNRYSFRAILANGTPRVLAVQTDSEHFSNLDNVRGEFIFDYDNPVIRVEYSAFLNDKRPSGICGGGQGTGLTTIATTNFMNQCFEFYDDDIINEDERGIRSSIEIKIVPIVYSEFVDEFEGTKSTTACVTEAIRFQAPKGLKPISTIYSWQALDVANPVPVFTTRYQRLLTIRDKAFEDLFECTNSGRLGGSSNDCGSFSAAVGAAIAAVQSFSGQIYQPGVFTYRYKTISNKNGEYNPSISLRDIYPNDDEFNRATNKPINIRLRPYCDKVSPAHSVTYLPETPSLNRAPLITQPSCSYADDAGVTLYFDRQIYSNEKVEFNLLKKLKIDGGSFEFVSKAIDSRTSFSTSRSGIGNIYRWPTAKEKLTAGDYKLLVHGFERFPDGLDPVPFCKQDTISFTISSPTKVSFSALHLQDEQCYNSEDGKIEITATGGTENYTYELNGINGNNYTSSSDFLIAQSPLTIDNIPPGDYEIELHDSNGCYDRESVNNPIKVERLTILKKQEITHTITQSPIQPGAPGLSDTVITVDVVSGGTPKSDINGEFMDFEVLINGSTSNTITGRADINGFIILGLEEGNHKIRYTDANDCSNILDLPAIIDPEPITYTLVKKDPSCSNASDGQLTVSEIAGGYPNYVVSWTKNGSPVIGNPLSINGDDALYTLTIKDERSGNIRVDNIKFDNVPTPIIFSATVGEITCYGESAEIMFNATGGNPPYEYGVVSGVSTNWYDSNKINLKASIGLGYRFLVREKNNTGCITEASNYYRITEPEEIELSDVQIVDNVIFEASSGEIDILVSGGMPPYTVTWKKIEDPAYSNIGLSVTGLTAGNYIPTITDSTGSCKHTAAPILVNQPPKLIVSIDSTTDLITCNGATGGLIATAQGGSGNYSYTWFKNGIRVSGATSTVISNQMADIYSVAVSDGFTSATSTANLEEPEPLEFDLEANDPLCYNSSDGNIHLIPSGGTPPYFYALNTKDNYITETALTNNTFENLAAGVYSLWIKDSNDCEIDAPETITLTNPTEITISSIIITDATTFGGNEGSIGLTVSGGTGSYTINWEREEDILFSANTESLSGLFYGNYMVYITDENGCSKQQSFSVREPLPIAVEIIPTDVILCKGETTGKLLATVTGGYPIESTPADFEYRWIKVEGTEETPVNTDFSIDEISNLGAGIYKVYVVDAKESRANGSFEITEPETLDVAVKGIPTQVLCHGEATGAVGVEVTGGPKDEITGAYLPYTYEWFKDGDVSFLANTSEITNLSAGIYSLTVTDRNLCEVTIKEITISQPELPLQITDVQFKNLTGYQNQSGEIDIEVEGGVAPYVYSWINTDDPMFYADSQDVENLNRGTYQLTVTDANECVTTLEQIITEPDQLIILIEALGLEEGIQCKGDETIVPLKTITTGGFGRYFYKWYEQGSPDEILFSTSETATLKAGAYTVEVTDENGNTDSSSYLIEEPDALVISESITHLLCNNDTNGSIDVTITGGVAPYRYQWSNGDITEDIFNLRAGEYTLNVQDRNDCSLSATFELKEPNALFTSIERTYPSANGESDGIITLTTIGGVEPYNYQWRLLDGTIISNNTNVLNNVDSGKYAVTVTDNNQCSVVIDDVDLFEAPTLEVFIDEATVISCFGDADTGSIKAIVNGGVPYNATKQYDYSWYNAISNSSLGSNSATLQNIGAGSYYAVVKDAIGTISTSPIFTLSEPEKLELTLDADFMNCGDQEDWIITTSVVGGTEPYQYFWSTESRAVNLESVTAGDYGLEVVDQRGCRVNKQITLTTPATLVAEHTVTTPTCFDGCDAKIELFPIGGTPPYQYIWNNGLEEKDLSLLCAGSYSVTITDAKNCTISKDIIIESPFELQIDLGEDITLCKGQTIMLDATIDDPNAVYSWSSDTGFSTLDPIVEIENTGSYTLEITDSKGCVATETIFIKSTTKEIYTDFIMNSQVFTGEKFLLFDISDPIPDVLAWEFPDEATVHHRDNDYAEISFSEPGEYIVQMDAEFGLCTALKTKRVVVSERTFDNTENNEDNSSRNRANVLIYPNPAPKGVFNIDVTLSKIQPVSLKVYNISNNVVLDLKRDENKEVYKFEYNLNHLPIGVYFVLFETTTGNQVHKLIIE